MPDERLTIRGDFPAFPSSSFPEATSVNFYPGLTRREYFAAKALNGLAGGEGTCDLIASAAVNLADALIEALDRPTP